VTNENEIEPKMMKEKIGEKHTQKYLATGLKYFNMESLEAGIFNFTGL
jgi:hypothetical protein